LHVQADIPNFERCIIRESDGVFSWTKDKKEGDNDHIENGHLGKIARVSKGLGRNDNDWHWLDAQGRCIVLFVSLD
jgi:hypothetical protein